MNMARQHIADAPFLVPGIAGAAELTAARRDTNAAPTAITTYLNRFPKMPRTI